MKWAPSGPTCTLGVDGVDHICTLKNFTSIEGSKKLNLPEVNFSAAQKQAFFDKLIFVIHVFNFDRFARFVLVFGMI